MDRNKKALSINSDTEFNDLCIESFHYQTRNIPVYKDYCKYLNITPSNISHYTQIPFLPVEFFKTKKIKPIQKKHETIFTSSGTSGAVSGKHYVTDIELYETFFSATFNLFYGDVKNYCILALLPSYLERFGSSLVYMADKLISQSKHPDSGFYMHDYGKLAKKLKKLNPSNQKVILLGVSYALLDLAEQFPIQLNNTIIMETGGMKGQRKELIRSEFHNILKQAFGVATIHSEYGMTELLSQAYSYGEGVFKTPPWMKILIRNTYDPFEYLDLGKTGGVNIIDLANINSCCFIETKDLGKKINNEKFEILGRFDNSDIRGCNLMAQ